MATKRFRGLPANQEAVFEQIAISNWKGHHPRTLEALERKGLIEFEEVCLGKDALGPIKVRRPYVPWLIHMEWCEWCSKLSEEEIEGGT